MKRFVIAGLLASSPFLAGTALAGSAHEFAEKGQLIFTADRLFPAFSYTKSTDEQSFGGTTNKDSTSGTSIALFYGSEPTIGSLNTVPRLAFDYAFIDHLTVGGTVILAFGLSAKNSVESDNGNSKTTTEVDAPKTTILGIAPRVGYALALTDLIGFWPRLGLTYASIGVKSTTKVGNVETTNKTSDSVFEVNIEPMFSLVPFKNVFFLFGPVLDVTLSGSRTVESGNTKTDSDVSVLHFGVETGLGVNF